MVQFFIMLRKKGSLLGPVYFNDADFPDMKNEYVLWVDIMGTKNNMESSVRTSSIFICKLHVAIMEAKEDGIQIYPMMDGAYITTESEIVMEKFIKQLFYSLSNTLIGEDNDYHRFLIKGALAYGPVIHGHDIPNTCTNCFSDNRKYVDSILLGIPMIQACKGEKSAPPFGIYCDESARIASKTFAHRWHKWFAKNHAAKVARAVQSYFDYSKEHYYELDYPKEKILEHEEKAKQYFRT